MAILGRGDYWGYNQHCVSAKSDHRDAGQVLRLLVGPMRGQIHDLAVSDAAALYKAPLPTCVAALGWRPWARAALRNRRRRWSATACGTAWTSRRACTRPPAPTPTQPSHCAHGSRAWLQALAAKRGGRAAPCERPRYNGA